MPFIHPTAVIDDDVVIGEKTRVWHFVHLSTGARIGKNCVLGQNVFVGNGVCIGDGVHVQNNVSIYSGVVVEDDVFLGPSCVFTNVINPRAFIEQKQEFISTRVCQGATVGANATIVCGNTLGEYCFIGAGSVVTHDVIPHSLVVGNPARPIGWICRCGQHLHRSEGFRCNSCGDRYLIETKSCQRIE